MSKTERFIKFIPSEEALYLQEHYPAAFLLLCYIAHRARRTSGNPDGLLIGDAILGNPKAAGLSRQQYRDAQSKLVELNQIQIIYNGKRFFQREKSTIKRTIKGMLVNLCNSSIWDINPEEENQQKNQRGTNREPTGNHKQEGRRRKKKEEEDHPSIPSNSAGRMTDDFSSKVEIIPGVWLTQLDLDACMEIKGSIEVVRESMLFIQASERRKHAISDWPNALANWKIENKAKIRIEDNIAFATKICKKFEAFTNGWRCSTYHDKKKDQKGLLFESESPYINPEFVSFSDGIFAEKVSKLLESKNMEIK